MQVSSQQPLRDDAALPISVRSNLPEWLLKLSRKNNLSTSANTVYLLHGTKVGNLESVVKDGLKTRFSLSGRCTYGRGLYFADKACKASQYAHDGCMIVCRVVLGRAEVLRKSCGDKMFASQGYHSALAPSGVTAAPHGRAQLHNEYIVFNEAACYPEFVIHFEKS